MKYNKSIKRLFITFKELQFILDNLSPQELMLLPSILEAATQLKLERKF